MAAPVRWQGCTIDVGVDFSGKGHYQRWRRSLARLLTLPHAHRTRHSLATAGRLTSAVLLGGTMGNVLSVPVLVLCSVPRPFCLLTRPSPPKHVRRTYMSSTASQAFEAEIASSRRLRRLPPQRATYVLRNRRHRVLETRAQGGCLKTIQLPASLGIATWQNRRPKLAGPAFLPLGSDHAPRWRRLALRLARRAWRTSSSLLVAQDHPVDDLDAPPRPLRSLCPRYDRTTPAHALPPQNEQRLLARSPSTVAAVYTVAGPLGGTMRTVFRAPAIDLSSAAAQ
ncbi:hypothetical protein F5146DRAFT_1002375, partial [Armillaria mellea]